MAILLLVADGRLALDDPLARFFANAPQRWRYVTVQQLLTHTAGLLDYEDLIPPDTTAQLRDRDVLDLVLPQGGGYHAPGAAFRTAIVRRLDARLTAIVLANRSEAGTRALAEALIAQTSDG